MTKTCPECKTTLTDDALECPACGALITGAEERESPEHRDVEVLMSAAEMHLERGEYDEAIDRCTAVLQQDPENAAAHIMLGDIYAEQERVQDAARWYEMALEIEPDNRVCIEKLENLRRTLSEKDDDSESTRNLGWFDRFVIGRGFESSIRIITGASAAFAALLIAAGLVSLYSHKQPDQAVGDSYPPEQFSYPDSRRKPVVVESTSAPGGLLERADHEIRLLRQLNDNQLVYSRRIAVDDARVDPRGKVTLIVTFRNHGNSANREEILLNSGAVASAGFSVNPQIAMINVRCVASVPDEAGRYQMDLVFVADVGRGSAPALKPNSTAEQIAPALKNQWWNPLARS
ncbi:MAG: tetratricopeptide repeat protein [Armatimonadota bacterium]|nr:tetratricopeptide repeat protein [Armatimonadota bacterium]